MYILGCELLSEVEEGFEVGREELGGGDVSESEEKKNLRLGCAGGSEGASELLSALWWGWTGRQITGLLTLGEVNGRSWSVL